MTYGQGVGIGFWIGLIGTIITVPLMYGYLKFIDTTPFDLFLQETEEKMIEGGAPSEQIEMSITWTRNLFWPMAFVMGILGSLFIALIVSIFTQKKSPEQII
jgi:hypothetical protein